MEVTSIPTSDATPVSAQMEGDSLAAVTEIAERIGSLSVSIAKTTGEITDTSTQVDSEALVFQDIASQTEEMSAQSKSVLASANNAVEISDKAEERIAATSSRLAKMVSEVTGLIGAVSNIYDQLSSLDTTLQRVAQVSSEVDNISRKTNLLSLNASIEAARAGRHGRGFMVVAQEVKDLSNLTGEATGEIQETISTLSTELRQLMFVAKGAVDSAAEIQSQTDGIGTEIESIPQTLSQVGSAQKDILVAATDISQATTDVGSSVSHLSSEVTSSSEKLKDALGILGNITLNAEAITGMVSRLGVETVDTPYIRAVQTVAKQISDVFSQTVNSGRITMRDLMDREYVAIPGSDPVQYMTRCTQFTDAVLPAFQEKMLELAPDVVFCAAVNVDGYLPTHNRKFSQPQIPGKPEVNASSSRNRRIFDDRVGLAAGNNKQPFLLQAYRRDMGNGEFAMMKDLSAPIFVNGTHWGGLRLAYKA